MKDTVQIRIDDVIIDTMSPEGFLDEFAELCEHYANGDGTHFCYHYKTVNFRDEVIEESQKNNKMQVHMLERVKQTYNEQLAINKE